MSNRETELGTLIIVVLKARNLNDKHSFYKQDVFAQLTFNGTTKKTKVAIKGGQHPEWDEEIRYPVMRQSLDKFRKLQVACYAKEPRSDEILGTGEVDIADTLKTGEFDDWVPLNVDGVTRGDLYLEMTFYSNGPAPAPLSVPSHPQRRPSKLERINLPPQAYPQSGSSVKPFEPGRHPTGPHTPQPHLHNNQSRPAQPTSIQPLSDRLATAALHNLLSDPMTGQQPPNNVYHNSTGHYSRSSSASPSRRPESPLPTLPREGSPPAGLPFTLLPGGGRSQSQQSPSHSSRTSPTPQLPSTLRAGAGRVVSSQNTSLHIPYHLPSSISSAPVEPPSGGPVSTTAPGDQRPEAAPQSFSFPIPMPHTLAPGKPNDYGSYAPPPVQANYTCTPPPAGYAPPQAAYPLPPSNSSYVQTGYQPISQQLPSFQDEYSDRYLQVRYSTPLPLPPGNKSPSHNQQPASPSTLAIPDQSHMAVPQQIENKAGQGKTQEEKDHELALALDRELNLI